MAYSPRIVISILSVVLMLNSCGDKRLKVFDVHLHGSPDPHKQLALLQANNVYKAAVSTSWPQQATYVSSDNLEILQGLMIPCPGGRVPYSLQKCFEDGSEWPSLAWVESLMRDKKIDFMGEVLTQYYGISSSDSRMMPYYALAEKYQIPVGIHTGSAGPDHGCPDFKESMGNPLLLTETIDQHPSIRLWIMHAGLPYYQETITFLKKYPSVYVDISAINNPAILPPDKFSAILEGLIKEGFGDRIMFGSDNGEISAMINTISSQSFLSDDQKNAILYKNAERFFQRSR